MTPEEFIEQVRKNVVDQTMTTYKDVFAKLPPDAASDPYWRRALTLYRSLDVTNQAILFEIIRQTMIDSTSGLLAVLDGGSAIEGVQQSFVLTAIADSQKINGGLLDLFLEGEE